MKNSHILLFLIAFATSCNGQNSKNSNKDSVDTYRNKLKTAPIPHFYGIKPNLTLQISEYIRRMLQDKNDNIWFGTNGDGVARYSTNSLSNGEKSLDYFTMKEGFSGTAVRGIVEDKKGNIWFGTDCGVSKYNPSAKLKAGEKIFTNFTTNEGLNANNVWSMYADRAGNIWVGTEKGVSKYAPSASKAGGKSFTNFPIPLADIKNPSPVFSQKLVWSFLEDKKGNIWFGTDGLGVYKYDPLNQTFIHFSEKDGLCNNNVSCMLEDKNGNLWFGTRFGGVSRYNPSISHKAGEIIFTNFTTKEGLSSNFIYTILEDKTGYIWLSALGGGICRYNPSASLKAGEKYFTNYSAKNGLTNLYVQSILEDKSGRLWFGSGAGLFRFDGKLFFNVTKKTFLQQCK